MVIFVDGEPVSNVEIAHIHGAKPGSPRYDESMTDEERRSFGNLILLCKPHHNVVDRLHRDDYPSSLLSEWKAEREIAAGIDSGSLANLTEDRLIELIEEAIGAAGPQRLVAVELDLGVATITNRGVITMPSETARNYFKQYSDLGPPVVVVTIRNQGALKAYVNAHGIRFSPIGAELSGRDDFPGMNPPLPCPVDVGESKIWIYDLELIKTTAQFFQERGPVDSLVGTARLGSGEQALSPAMPIEHLGD